MSTKTSNYKLELPEDNDFYNIHVLNTNMKIIDTALQENKQSTINHADNTNIHITPELQEKFEKINTALQPTENVTQGNFVQFNADGTLSDSGLNANSFENAEHNEKSVYSQNGVHNLRYHDEKMQIFDGTNWIDITQKSTIMVTITVDTGSTVIVTDGVTTLTGESINGECTINIPNFADWTFTATSVNGKTSDPVTLTIDTVKWYTLSLSLFKATIMGIDKSTVKPLNVLSFNKATATNLNTGTVYEYTGTSNLYPNFTVTEIGEYEISIKWSSEVDFGDAEYKRIITVTEDVTNYSFNFSYPRVQLQLTLIPIGDVTVKIIDTTNESMTCTKTMTNSDRGYAKKGTMDVFLSQNNKAYKFIIDMGLQHWEYVTTSGDTLRPTFTQKIYGVEIDLTNPDPTSSVSYSYDSVGMTGGSANWDDTDIFSGITPVQKNANSENNLNKSDFSKTESGVNIAEAMSSYDIFIKFPKLYYRIIHTTNKLFICLSTENIGLNSSKYFKARYIGAYLASKSSDYLESLSGKTPYNQSSFNYAKSVLKDGYRLFNYDDLLMLQLLFIMRYKSLDSKSVLGQGYRGQSNIQQTGRTSAKGMYYGSTSTSEHVKFAGIEDLWGNLFQMVDGITFASDGSIKMNGTTVSNVSAKTHNGYLKQPHSAELPFLHASDATYGSSTTYFTDQVSMWLPTSGEYIAIHGGSYSSGIDQCGLFHMNFIRKADSVQGTMCPRIALDA